MKSRKIFRVVWLVCAVALPVSCVWAQEGASAAPAPSPQSAPTPETRIVNPPPVGRSKPRVVAEQHQSGSISGRVVTEDGQPLPFASVSLSAPGGSRVPTSAITDAEGKFRVDNLEPAAYVIYAFAPGFVTMPDPLAERGVRAFHHLGEFVTVTMLKGGVVSGMVTSAGGEPIVGIRVRANYLRDLDGRGAGYVGAFYGGEQQTDDRGVYRIYGLPSGVYVVVAGGGNNQSYGIFPSAYDAESPTYFPSNTRDGAAEVNVRTGQETNGIDIRHRGEQGHTVSGKVEGVGDSWGSDAGGISLLLTHVATGMSEFGGFIPGRNDDRTFSFDALADGDYDISARRSGRDGETQASAPRRVNVRGADVTGVVLNLLPLASISGRVRVETAAGLAQPSGECPEKRDDALAQETVVVIRRDTKDVPKDQWRVRQLTRRDTVPDAQGDFAFRGLDPGRYHPEVTPTGEEWYVRTVTLPSNAASPVVSASEAGGGEGKRRKSDAAPTAKANPPSAPTAKANPPAAPARAVAPSPSNAKSGDLLTLAAGQNVGGVNIVLTYGAASMRGQVATTDAGDGARVASGLWRVYLVPVAREQSDDTLRYAESPVAPDGSFAFSHLAPARYWLIARPATENDPQETPRPVAWEAEGRARLRRDAEAANIILDLQPCQRLNGFTLRK